jgi:hypothetical protein
MTANNTRRRTSKRKHHAGPFKRPASAAPDHRSGSASGERSRPAGVRT